MAEQQTAIKSILGDTLIFNYPVRKRTDEEVKKLNRVRTTRIIELKERLKRIEANLKESIDETEFSTLEEAYLMNRFKTKPVFDED
jgi:Skp family chaperone for outer membrane proteins